MYRFTDPNESPVMTSPSLETVFDGIILDRELSDRTGSFQTLSIQGRGVMNYSYEVFQTGETALLGNRRIEPRFLVIKYHLRDDTTDGLHRRFERLNRILSEKEKELIFTDDSSLQYTATFTAAEEFEETSNDIVSTLTFICPDPKKYAKPIRMQNVTEIRLRSLYPVHPVIDIHLEKEETEILLQNVSKGLHLSLKSESPFLPDQPIEIDTLQWTIQQDGVDRIRDLVITSDLEDFVVSDGDRIELSVPGSLSLTVEGAFL